MKGYFRVHRRILDSQVFAHQTALKIWIWCLAKVNYRERFVPLKIGRGEICVNLKPGQFLFGRFKAEEELNIDGSTIYKWMQKFASEQFDNMIKIESNNQYSIVTVNNWDEYQNDEDNIVTTEEQPSDKQVATKEQPKNTDNKDKKDKKDNNRENTELRSTVFISEVWTYKENYPPEMLTKFCNYWTEKNKSGSKMRFELEKTFEISKRLATWNSRDKEVFKPVLNQEERFVPKVILANGKT